MNKQSIEREREVERSQHFDMRQGQNRYCKKLPPMSSLHESVEDEVNDVNLEHMQDPSRKKEREREGGRE